MMKRRDRERERERAVFLRGKEIAGLRAWSAVDVVIGARNFNGGEYL
jgi:hypothetical protein